MSLLVGVKDGFEPKVILVVGNGALGGPTWEPVTRTKKDFSQGDFFKRISWWYWSDYNKLGANRTKIGASYYFFARLY